MNTLTGTPKELEKATGINQAVLSILLRMAEKNGQAKIVKTVKVEGARGKPANVWEVNSEFTVKLV